MLWNNSYNINFKKLALLLLPTMLRRNILGEFVKILVNPVNWLHTCLMDFRKKKDFRLTHNGQRCYLRRCLNEIYDPIWREIEIGDAEARGETLIFERNDTDNRVALIQPEQPLMLNSRGFPGGGIDFVVKIPSDLFSNEGLKEKIKATVSEYKLASKQFDIISKERINTI